MIRRCLRHSETAATSAALGSDFEDRAACRLTRLQRFMGLGHIAQAEALANLYLPVAGQHFRCQGLCHGLTIRVICDVGKKRGAGDLERAYMEQVDGLWVMDTGGAKYLQVRE